MRSFVIRLLDKWADAIGFTKPRGAAEPAITGCPLFLARAAQPAAVATTGDASPAGTQGDDRGLRIVGWGVVK